ncbi:hypothetical protein M3616_10915 [Bacillus velezensis]|uniref:hypothetical protein n=1 Tax=Bacillus TaxID=1386 RepID=UPI000CF1C754|nr:MULTISPECIES: hypothetical protein [Bacillus]MCM3278768.1 hypothetical protein [Bacillus velezensis]MCM3349751.1 hypothetical protein [Bacillus velezensis]MCV4329517.1 hypothetical protein [Bacillus velezensis]MDU0077245.1 hypothetical protein [Bacillus sp. IG2]MDU0102322.1 hypothetical protein [Bacillus sp. IS1]
MSKKKIILLISTLSVVVVGIILAITIPMYLNRLDTSNLDAIAEKVGNDKGVKKNFNQVWMSKTDKSNDKVYDLSLAAKPSFTSLSDKEKLLKVGEAMEVAQKNSNFNKINCGKDKVCSISRIYILPAKNDKAVSYEVAYDLLNNPEENTLLIKDRVDDNPESTGFQRREVTYSENDDEQSEDEEYQEKKIAIGMTKQEVIQLKDWGRPMSINKTTTASGINEQWVYGSRYLYFDNGVLTTIQE